jgi:hypothetical protein
MKEIIKCSKCGLEKVRGKFYVKSNRKGVYQPCKSCQLKKRNGETKSDGFYNPRDPENIPWYLRRTK